MKRWCIPILAMFFSGMLAHAQEAPDGAPLFSSWSFMQQPQPPEKPGHQQPVPEPNPETKPAQNPTPAQPSSPSSQPGQTSDNQVPSAQTFTGIVSKDADSFVLKVSDTSSYKLDN